MSELETPIQTMIDATNRGDSDTFLSACADDAVLTDWGVGDPASTVRLGVRVE